MTLNKMSLFEQNVLIQIIQNVLFEQKRQNKGNFLQVSFSTELYAHWLNQVPPPPKENDYTLELYTLWMPVFQAILSDIFYLSLVGTL